MPTLHGITQRAAPHAFYHDRIHLLLQGWRTGELRRRDRGCAAAGHAGKRRERGRRQQLQPLALRAP